MPDKTLLDLSYFSQQYTIFFHELRTTTDLHVLEKYELDLLDELAVEYIKIYISFYEKFLMYNDGYQTNQ